MSSWNENVAVNAARKAARLINRQAPDPVLVRLGSNAVFMCGSNMIRVSPPDYDPVLLDEQMKLAAWLTDREFPTSRPLPEIWIVDGCYVTAWERLEAVALDVNMFQLGQLVEMFHTVTGGYVGTLPRWDPSGRLGSRLHDTATDRIFTQAHRELLLEWHDRLVDRVADLEFQLPEGLIHGDVHVGNVIVCKDGLYLIDFDRIMYGPREWDLVQILAAQKFFGRDSRNTDEFVRGYGTVVPADKLEPLINLRALYMTSWLLTLPRTEPVAQELETRLGYWLNPDGPLTCWSAV